MTTTLAAKKGGPSQWPWAAFIAGGPSDGYRISDWFSTKRETAAWIAAHEHLPWGHLIELTAAGASSSDLIVTVSRASVVWQERTVARLEAELSDLREVIVQVDGSAMLVDAARRRRLEREAAAAGESA